MFGLQGKIYLGMFAAAGLFYGASQIDKNVNYVETTATVTSVKVDCFIKSGRKSVVEKESGELAYMDCRAAPYAALKFGHKKTAIQKRAQIEYEFVSPVDQSIYNGKMTKENSIDKYQEGAKFVIYAHKEDAGKSRVN